MLNNLKNFIKNRKIENYFKTNFKRNVLISYIVYPLRFKKYDGHNNQLEIKIICNLFKKFKYNVDVVFYLSSEKLDYGKYDLIFGFGEPFNNSFIFAKNIRRILYVTGSHPSFQNKKTLNRALEVFNKTGKLFLNSCRIIESIEVMQFEKSDLIILTGNSFTRKTYENVKAKIKTIDLFYNPNIENLHLDKLSKKSYLFFTSNGAIHRGLDLVLEYFEMNPSLELYVFGKYDNQFTSFYKKKLELKNVHYFGHKPLDSRAFKNAVRNCAFQLLPSVSEGQSTSVINASSFGLIPIISKECGINITSSMIEIESVSQQGVFEAIDKSRELSKEKVFSMYIKNRQYFRNKFNIKNFQSRMENILDGESL